MALHKRTKVIKMRSVGTGTGDADTVALAQLLNGAVRQEIAKC